MPPESRSRRLRLEDILTAALRIQSYTAGMSAEEFLVDLKTIDAVVRNFEVMGEAARHLDGSWPLTPKWHGEKCEASGTSWRTPTLAWISPSCGRRFAMTCPD